MDSTKRKDIVRPAQSMVTDALEQAVTRAYEEGLRDGEAKAAGDFAAMFTQRFGAPLQPDLTGKMVFDTPLVRQPPPAASSERRKYGYGVVTGVIRNIINGKRIDGVTIGEIAMACLSDFGIELNKVQVREAIKRMSAAEEIRSQNRRWFPTSKFRRDLIVDYGKDEVSDEAPEGGDRRKPSKANVVDLYASLRETK